MYLEVHQSIYYNAYNDMHQLRVGCDGLDAHKYAIKIIRLVCTQGDVRTKPTQVLKERLLPMHATYFKYIEAYIIMHIMTYIIKGWVLMTLGHKETHTISMARLVCVPGVVQFQYLRN